MNKKATLLWMICIILLVACGGGAAEPEASNTDSNNSSTSTESNEDVEETTSSDPVEETEEEMEEVAEESEATDEPTTEEETEDEGDSEAAAEESEETASTGSPFGDRPMTGTDPDTGLVVNPEIVSPGDTFIVRGEIISMNLTPVTSPEFLIQSPDGLKFRLRSQALADTFFEDGDQLQAHQYRNGLLAQATAMLPADASPSDIPVSEDLVLLKDE